MKEAPPPMPVQVGPLRGGGGRTFADMSWQDAVQRIDGKVDGNFKFVLTALGGGFVFLMVALATGYLLLAGKIEDGNSRVLAKLEAISTQIADLKTDVAVLQDRQKLRTETR